MDAVSRCSLLEAAAGDLAGFVAPWRQPEIGTRARRAPKARRAIEGRGNRHSCNRPHTGRCHQQADVGMPLGNCPDPAVERGDADKDVASGLHQSFEDRDEFQRDRQLASDDFLGPALELANPLSEHHDEGLQQAPDLVLQLDAHSDQGLTRRQYRAVDIAMVALDLHGLEPAATHDLVEERRAHGPTQWLPRPGLADAGRQRRTAHPAPAHGILLSLVSRGPALD